MLGAPSLNRPWIQGWETTDLKLSCKYSARNRSRAVPFTGWSFSGAYKAHQKQTQVLRLPSLRFGHSEFVTFLNLRDLLAHKSFVFSTEFRVKTKKSQALRMTGLVVESTDPTSLYRSSRK